VRYLARVLARRYTLFMSYRALLVAFGLVACAAPEDLEIQEQAATNGTTIVSLTFDDTFADNYQVAALAEARGMRATFYINSARIGQPNYLTFAEVADLEARGHEIAGHTLTHARLASIPVDEARYQVCNDRKALLELGFRATSFAYPFSSQNATVREIAEDCGYNSARLVGGLVTASSCVGCPYGNPRPPPDPFGIRTHDSVEQDTTLDEMKANVMRVEQNGGGWMPMVFHHVCDGCDQLAISPATLAAFLDWLALRTSQGTVVATVDEAMGGTVKPAVAAPPPAKNLLQNASLETDASGDQVPDCWQRGGTGTNSATYTLSTIAYDGVRAQRIDMTSFTSGARRLVSAQDAGTCAPPAVPGRQYTVTARYISNTQPLFSIYYRNATGSWVWFAQSPRLPASSSYALGSYTTPALPAGATAISVGLSIVGVGSLTMDAFTLVEVVPADTTAPAVSLTSPAAGATVSGTVNIAATASDAVGIARVDFLVDGTPVGTDTTSPYAMPWDTAAFAGQTVALTARAYDTSSNVAVSAPHVVTVPPVNLLQNASLETDANGDQVPDCWQRGGSGTNAATYTLTSNAFTGVRAQRIDMTSYTSGARRIVSLQDTGTCAPAAIAGHRYTVTARYISNTPPVFSIYYRNASGSWVFFAQSPAQPASSTYALGSYTTAPLPAGATHISVGLSIIGLGSLTMDDFTLVDAGP
jgi:peptidoglycan/xylan/chitin deacetylase (PgdA/CDA1 family)